MKDKIKALLSNMDKGFYKDARAHTRSSFGHLADQFAEQGYGATEADINTRVARMLALSGMRGASTDLLPRCFVEGLEQYAADVWALEKALGAEGVRVKGAGADRLEKFFATSSSTILFPAFVDSQIMAGILATPILASLIATETNIDSHVYEALHMADTQAQRELRIVAEGGNLPTTTLTTSEHTVNLVKFGRLFEASYESLRLQRLNVVALFLQRIGRQIALDETDWAIETLIAGDGNNNAVVDTDAEVSGTLDYDELVRLFLAFPDGYNMTTSVTNAAQMRTILNMGEFKDPMSGFTFQRNGVLPGPMGANWFVWRSTGSTSFSTDRILAIDNSIALEQITEQGVMTETDKLIEKQMERTAITKWTGFAKMDPNATQCLDIVT